MKKQYKKPQYNSFFSEFLNSYETSIVQSKFLLKKIVNKAKLSNGMVMKMLTMLTSQFFCLKISMLPILLYLKVRRFQNVSLITWSLLQHQIRSSFITSKSLSKNLSNEKNHWCFCCLRDKTRLKMPILWKHRVCLFSLLSFFDERFDVINADSFLKL
jgi:hypothetical protein